MQTSEQLTAFRALCAENGLSETDVWQHKQSGHWIMSKVGAEKVQGRNNIDIDMEVAAAGIDFAIVKVTATRKVKAEGERAGKTLTARTLGSANPKNCTQISYYAEMAEKRATVRAVLKLMGFSKLGVYGEEEAEDFARARNQGGPSLNEATTTRPTLPAAPAPTPPASPQMAASAASGPSSAEDDGLPMDKLVVLSFLSEAETLAELQSAWVNEAKGWHLDADVFAAKESRKAHLQANQSLPHAR